MPPTAVLTSAGKKVERLLISGVAMLRVLQLAYGLPVLLTGGLTHSRSGAFIGGAYLAAVTWSAVLFTVALRTNRVTRGWVHADLALSVVWLLTVPRMCEVPECASVWQWWVVPPAMGSAILAIVFAPRWHAVTGTVLIGVAYVAGIWELLTTSQDALGSGISNAYFLIGFSSLAWIFSCLMRSSARQVDSLTAEAIEARAREAAARASYEERTRQFDVLHHTALSTLSKIARGGLDHRAEEVRALCARDADFLRNLVTGCGDERPSDFVASLAGVVRDKQALGLKVYSRFHALPATVPTAVAPVLLGAAREALTNAAKHAGTDEAWLTAVGDGDGLRMVIVDRGVGFEPEKATSGRGLIRELRHSIIEIGGKATVTSAPGHGTVVEVLWKP